MTDSPAATGFPGRKLPPPTFFDPSFERLPASAAFDPERPGPVVLLFSRAADRDWVADAAIALATGWNATGRRTVLADLALEDPVLGDRIGIQAMEGVTDIFLYGASLARSARPVPGRGFYLLPAGTYTDDPAAILRHPRWEKLIAGFQETGASLLLLAPTDAPGLAALGRWAGEAIVLAPQGDDGVFAPVVLDGFDVRAWLTPPVRAGGGAAAAPPPPAARFRDPEPAPPPPRPREPEPETPPVVVAPAAPVSELPVPDPEWEKEPAPKPKRRVSAAFLLVLLLVLLAGGAALAYLYRPDLFEGILGGGARQAPAREAGPAASRPRPRGPVRAAGTALPFAVFVAAFDTYEAARQRAQSVARAEPEPYYVIPENRQGRLYYKVYSGVLGDSLQALSLRERLIDRGYIDVEAETSVGDLISERPLAFDLGEFPTHEAAEARAAELERQAVPAYPVPMPMSDGTERWKLYGGAFPDSAAAAPMRTMLAAKRLPVTLVRRTGRPPRSAQMKLRSLQLHGFKSFPDRTTLELRDGVTAIVGSNGCGKSNTADAVRWVLGETKASALRGGKMEEVIFQGSIRRRPLNYAEVTLVFSNEDGRVPLPQTEIEIGRKVFREGGSEYFLNRNPCRLRDVHDLLRDTGLGSDAYSIIEIGMIDSILSERAEERRTMFEEAAGIGKYKDRRKAAQRRLEAAEGDLARLGDLVAEVESKVRSLARQKRRAQRHAELQARRLDLEVAATRAELEALAAELATGEKRLAELEREARESAAERATAEAVLEERRLEAAELGRKRAEAAQRLDAVRQRLDQREREILLADERRANAEMRIAQLVKERAELLERAAALDAEAGGHAAGEAAARDRVEGVRERLEARIEENEGLRATLAAHRQASEAAAARSRDVARDIAGAEGDRAAAERRRQEALERVERLLEQEAQLGTELAVLGEQTELWTGQGENLRGRLDAASGAAERERERVRALRAREAELRELMRAAEDRVGRLAAQVAAREALEAGYEGFSPAVGAVMAERGRFPGVLAPLADFVRATTADRETAQSVESFLGTLLQALVVEDLAAARRVRRWFRDEWTGGGTLLLLPLDAPGVREAIPAASHRLGVSGGGPGQGWVEVFLEGLVVVRGEDPLDSFAGGARVDSWGDTVDPRGVVRLGQPVSGEGILARREELARLRGELEDAEVARDRRVLERDEVARQLGQAEEGAAEAEDLRRMTESQLRQLDAEAAAQGHRRGRLERERDEVAAGMSAAQRQAVEASQRIVEMDARLEELHREAGAAGAEAARAGAGLAELDAAWEAARDEEAELRVALARAEGELREVERAAASARQGAAAARARTETLGAEAEELRRSLEGLSGIRERAGGDVEALFAERDREAGVLSGLEARLGELEAEVAAAEERARVARRREAEAAEGRHRTELERTEREGRLLRSRERLEVEWGRPWDVLAASANPVEEGDPESWRAEVREMAQQVDALGPINMLAVQEHEEEDRRLRFLLEQQADLTKARDDLAAAIRQINKTAREVFQTTFDAVRANFHRTFQSLFQGGECDVWLADPDDPLESPIEIHASPRGKKTQRIHLLSGGERTLTALSLLFAIYLVKPAPFCLFDEVDAPLDESNVGRFIQLLEDFKAQTQFIVITHNPRTMEAADWIYGVTMEEPGVSTVVGVELEGAWSFSEPPTANV